MLSLLKLILPGLTMPLLAMPYLLVQQTWYNFFD
jgi:hypothetical protein